MTSTDPFRDWLIDCLKLPGKSQSGLARHLGVHPSAINKVVHGTRQLKSHEIAAAGDYFEQLPPGHLPPHEGAPERMYVPLDEVESWDVDGEGEGYDRDSYSPRLPGAIPELDARAGAGEGAVGEVMVIPVGGGTASGHKIIGEWVLPPEYLREAVRNPSRAIVLSIQGDSMMPNFAPGDRVVVDLSVHDLQADGVYLISDGVNAPQIKRLQIVPFTRPAKCRVISDNPRYTSVEVETDMLHIMGRVSAYIGRL